MGTDRKVTNPDIVGVDVVALALRHVTQHDTRVVVRDDVLVPANAKGRLKGTEYI